MSGQLSPDGMHYWDGYKWVSTLSPDGRHRWNGSQWIPVTSYTYASRAEPKVQREPTSWTRPLQYAVIAWYAISAIDAITVPFWMGGQIAQIMNQSSQRQQQQNPNLAPPPGGFADAMAAMMTGALWLSALFGVAIAVLFIVAALKRWTWAFYVILALLGLGLLSGPSNLISLAGGNLYSSFNYSFPSWIYVVGLILWVPNTALFIWMLIAAVKRGPWAMRKLSPAGSPAT